MTHGERIVGAWDGYGADFSERLKVSMAKSIDETIKSEKTLSFGNGWNAAVEACAKIADKEGSVTSVASGIAAAIRAQRI